MPESKAIVWRGSTVRANTFAIQWEYTTHAPSTLYLISD
jgi:hypothetical protein